MSVVDVGIAAVVIDGQLVAVILEDITCISCIISSCQNIYLAASEALLNSTVSFVYPRALLKVKIDIVNIGLHFFHKDVRLMLPLVVKHSIVAA